MLTDVLRSVLKNMQMAPWWAWAFVVMGFAMITTASLWGDTIEAWCVRHRVQRLVSRLMWLPLMVLMLVVLVAGCATSRFEANMDAAVGRLTMDEALMRLGPPTYERHLGSDTLLAWERSETSAYSYRPYPAYQGPTTGVWGGAMAGLSAGAGVQTMVDEDRQVLMLRFGPDGTLTAWRSMTR
jgi:hypothetical protein